MVGGVLEAYRRAPGIAAAVATPATARAVALFVATIMPAAAWAMEMPDGCRSSDGEPARLVSMDAAATLQLEDGRAIRLADVDFGGSGEGGRAAGARSVTASVIASLLPGQKLVVYPVSAKPDRWGRMAAHVRVVEVDENENLAGGWLAGLLVASGQARVLPLDSAVGCIDALYGLEARARQARLGLWQDPANRVWSANDPKLGDEATGAWRIVAGRVVSVGITKTNHYLNFGRDWDTDFTVTVRTDDVERFAAAGRHPVGLEGRFVRVRGWLRKRNGAVIDVKRPGEIEVVDGRE